MKEENLIARQLIFFRIVEVKNGTDTRGKDWYLVKAESAESKINLFCNAFNFPRFAENVGKRCELSLNMKRILILGRSRSSLVSH